jgi:hypothetical protein
LDENFYEMVWQPFVPEKFKNDTVRAARVKQLFRFNQCLIKYHTACCLRGDNKKKHHKPELTNSQMVNRNCHRRHTILMRWTLDVEDLHQELVALLKGPITDTPASFIQEFLQSVVVDCRIRMDVPLDNMPQTFNPACSLVLALATAVFSFVDDPMDVKFFAIIVSTPKISEYLCTFVDVVPNHLGTCYFCSVFHNKCSNVFRAAFVET